jgi:hypothetical protein
MPDYDDPSGLFVFDADFVYDDDGPPPVIPGSGGRRKRMDKLKVDYSGYDASLTKETLETHTVGMTGNASYPTPLPVPATVAASILRIGTAISALATADAVQAAAVTELDDATREGQGILNQRATNCNGTTPNNRAALQSTNLPLIGERTPSGPTQQVLNLKLTEGDNAGEADASWNSQRNRASAYQMQSSMNFTGDPATATWKDHDPVTKSRATLGGFTSGARIWVRVRSIGPNGPGPWSDPATIIAP